MAGSEFYDHTSYPSQGAVGSSSAARAEFELIEAGFGKLPPLAGNGGKLTAVNSSGTAMEALTAAQALAAIGAQAAADKDANGGVAGLTGFAINVWNSVKTFKSFLSFSGTANRAHALPDKDGTLALLSDLTYKTQTGSVTITQAASNEMARTHASASVVLPIAYLDAGYQVVAEIESAAPFSGSAGLLLVSNRATNGFTLSMTGSATSATLRWKTLNPNA